MATAALVSPTRPIELVGDGDGLPPAAEMRRSATALYEEIVGEPPENDGRRTLRCALLAASSFQNHVAQPPSAVILRPHSRGRLCHMGAERHWKGFETGSNRRSGRLSAPSAAKRSVPPVYAPCGK